VQENQQKIGLNFDAYQMLENELVIVIPNDKQQWCEELTSTLHITSTINYTTRKQGFFIGKLVKRYPKWLSDFTRVPSWISHFQHGHFD
jgi:hypothetical protein